jgi:hypothetical protein
MRFSRNGKKVGGRGGICHSSWLRSCTDLTTYPAEERQDRNEKRRRVDEHRQQDMAKAAKAAKEGGMTMNGTEYVQVTTVASAVPSRIHPSLPSRPGFEVVPKAQSVQSGQPPAGESGPISAI